MVYSAWFITDHEIREELLSTIPPLYEDVKADHVTYQYNLDTLPPHADEILICGYVDDGTMQTMICSVDGNFFRTDGEVYHITWSKTANRRSKESISVINSSGFIPFSEPIPVGHMGGVGATYPRLPNTFLK